MRGWEWGGTGESSFLKETIAHLPGDTNWRRRLPGDTKLGEEMEEEEEREAPEGLSKRGPFYGLPVYGKKSAAEEPGCLLQQLAGDLLSGLQWEWDLLQAMLPWGALF